MDGLSAGAAGWAAVGEDSNSGTNLTALHLEMLKPARMQRAFGYLIV
jgi:hypothetical protein